MSIRIASIRIACLAVLLSAFTIAVPPVTAMAQTATTKEEAKAKAAEEKKAKAEEKKAAKTEKKAKRKSERTAAQARQKQCGEEWKEKRAAGKVEKYMTWPKYYSACNKRLKEKAA